MRFARLFQPRNPLFWIMLSLNALSMVIGWLLQHRPLNTLGMLVLGGFALSNAILGTWLAWRLVKEPPHGKAEP